MMVANPNPCDSPAGRHGMNTLNYQHTDVFFRRGQVFKFDPASAAALSAEVRGHAPDEEGGTTHHPPLLDVRRMWAMIEVCVTASDDDSRFGVSDDERR